MRTIKASEFKAKCLKFMDEVAASSEPVEITKHGVPVARLVPIRHSPQTVIGALKGSITILGDIISPIDTEWDALR